MSVKFLDLAAQYQKISNEINKAIKSVIENSCFVGGDIVKKFEQSFADYHNAAFGIGVANGTDALEIALEALDLPKNAEVLVPANSFIATSEAVTRTGLKVRFIDCNPKTYLLDLNDAEKKISSKTCAIIPVHLYGQACNMEDIVKFATKHNLKVVEDCAQAHGASFNNKKIGNFGEVACFSFYPGKNLGAYGDAGAILTNDKNIAERCRMIANHGRIAKYDHSFEGRNSRLDALQAAVLLVKLKHLPEWTLTRQKIAAKYCQELDNIKDLILPEILEKSDSVYHLFVVQTNKRDDLQKYLLEQGIETGIHYPIALPKLKAYEYLNQAKDNPIACSIDKNLLSLPMGDHITEEKACEVINVVKNFFNEIKK